METRESILLVPNRPLKNVRIEAKGLKKSFQIEVYRIIFHADIHEIGRGDRKSFNEIRFMFPIGKLLLELLNQQNMCVSGITQVEQV